MSKTTVSNGRGVSKLYYCSDYVCLSGEYYGEFFFDLDGNQISVSNVSESKEKMRLADKEYTDRRLYLKIRFRNFFGVEYIQINGTNDIQKLYYGDFFIFKLLYYLRFSAMVWVMYLYYFLTK